MADKEIACRIICGAIAVIVFALSYKTKDLDGVKGAFIYRVSYAFIMARGVSFLAVDVLHLW